MKRRLITIVSMTIMLLSLTGCNKQIIDTNYTFNKAYIEIGDEVIEVEIDSWTDYEDGEQIQIKAKDGTVYLSSANKCVLVKEN